MTVNRIAASYVYTLDADEPIRNGYVEYDEDGTVTAVGVCEDVASEKRFYDGAIVPGFVNAHCQPVVASWVVPHSVGPRFPGPLLRRTRCPDTSPNSTL